MKKKLLLSMASMVIGGLMMASFTHATDFTGVIVDEETKTITITNGTTSVRLADRNLGATEIGYGSGASIASYGDYYQGGGTTGYAATLSAEEAIEAGFNSGWNSTGWANNQGPCPDGFHIPSLNEWATMINIFSGNGNSKPLLYEAINLPFAGARGHQHASITYTFSDGGEIGGVVWGADVGVRGSGGETGDGILTFGSDGLGNFVMATNPAEAFPIRCFADSGSFANAAIITFDTQGGSAVSGVVKFEGDTFKGVLPTTPTLSGYHFLGWYRDTDFTSKWDFDTDVVTGSMTLYAKWGGDTIYRGITGGVLYISDSGNVIDSGNSIDLTALTKKGSFGYNAVFSSYSSIPWYSSRSSITSVKVIGNVAPTNTAYWFYNFTNCTSMDLSGLDTSNVSNMSYMFYGCSELTSLDLSNFNTSQVTDMKYMFEGCSSLESLDVSHFDTSNVTDMSYMFHYCNKLTSLDLSHFDTSKVTDMNSMFYYCNKLTSLDLSHFNTSKVTNMTAMFAGCNSLISLDLSNFNTSKVTSYSSMLYYLSSLVDLNVPASLNNNISSTSLYNYPLNNSNNRWTYSGTEYSSTSSMKANEDRHYYAKVAITYKDKNGNQITDKNFTKYHIYGTETILTNPSDPNFSGFYLNSGFTAESKITSLSADYRGNVTIYVDWDVSQIYRGITDGGVLYISDSGNVIDNGNSIDLTTLTNNGSFGYNAVFDSSSSAPRYSYSSSITSVKVIGNVAPISTAYWFYYLTNCTSMDLSGLDTSNVTNMSSMFHNCRKLTSLDVSNFNTSKVTDMSYMFHYCSSLESLDVSNFNTSQVTDMSWMFASCSLTSLDVSNFDTSQVTDMSYMFTYCSLTSLDVSNFDTSKVTDMGRMFYRCYSLTSLDVSNFNTSQVTSYSSMLPLPSLIDLNVSASLNNKISSTDLRMPLGNSNNRWTYSGTEYSSTSSMKANEARHYYAAFQITYKDKGGDNFSASTETLPTYHTYKSDTLLPVSIKSGYVTKWYTDTGCTENRITMIGGEDYTGAITLYADYSKYTVTWKDGDTVLMVDEEVDYGEIPQYNGAKPKKGNYTFKGWSPEISALTGTETEVEYVAVWEAPQSSGGGGRRVVTETSSEKEEKNVETKDTETKDVETQEEINDNNESVENNSIDNDSAENNSVENNVVNEYSQEMKDAYKFAYEKGITTMDSIDKADMNGSLTRIAMAKMLSNFAINVLGRTPTDIEVPDFSDVSEQMNSDYDNGISLAYQLNIMGVNMPNNEFRPNDLVTRAEFGTALSRLLFGLSDGEGVYYETHLTKLKEEGIITNDNPNLEEARGYIMLMLMRSVK